MSKYKVTISETIYFDVIVECDNIDNAEDMARDKLKYKINIISKDTKENLDISILDEFSHCVEGQFVEDISEVK